MNFSLQRCTMLYVRERVKIFNEGLLVVNKCFPSIPSRKRSRPDVLSGERPSALFASDRAAVGAGASKLGTQSHTLPSSFELEQQKPEERSKTVIPNKRTRTSMVDPRVCFFELFDYSLLYWLQVNKSCTIVILLLT